MSSPSGGRPSCRQASGGRCIWPSGQILGTPHRANGSAKSRIRASLAARPTVDTDSRIGSSTCSTSSMCSIGLTNMNGSAARSGIAFHPRALPSSRSSPRSPKVPHRRCWLRGFCKSAGPSRSPPPPSSRSARAAWSRFAPRVPRRAFRRSARVEAAVFLHVNHVRRQAAVLVPRDDIVGGMRDDRLRAHHLVGLFFHVAKTDTVTVAGQALGQG